MSGWEPYVVRQGDYLAKLAHRYGFDADAVWNDDRNADLRKLRSDPQTLCPCDILYIPEPKAPRTFALTVGVTNSFVSTTPTVPISITLEHDGQPVASTECVVHGLPELSKVTTGSDGSLTFDIPVTVTSVTLVVPKLGMVRTIKVGHLDPANEPCGIVERLRNLGYLSSGTEALDADLALAHALSDFQVDCGLPETGVADDATIAKLSEAHGS